MVNTFHEVVLSKSDLCEGYQFFEDPKKALRFFKDGQGQSPDAIFLDVNMPGMNGWEFIVALTQDQKQVPPIFMLTTSTYEADKRKAAKFQEVKGFLQKPLTLPTLKGVLEDLSAD